MRNFYFDKHKISRLLIPNPQIHLDIYTVVGQTLSIINDVLRQLPSITPIFHPKLCHDCKTISPDNTNLLILQKTQQRTSVRVVDTFL